MCYNINAQEAESVKKVYEYLPYIDITAGYVPKAEYKSLKASVSVNNLLLKRVGFYTSVEKATASDYFTHIIGVTGTLFKSVYLFGGMDFFTKYGLITNGGFDGTRKELGLGFSPYKFTVVRLGWSSSVGPTFAVGVKFNL